MLSLSNILKINAISSGATGLLLSIFPSTAAHIFDTTSTTPFIAVGIFLVLFALFVFTASNAKPINNNSVKTIIALDTVWVVASAVAVLFLYSSISSIGSVLIVGVALWVALMAYLQNRGLKRTSNTNVHNAIAV